MCVQALKVKVLGVTQDNATATCAGEMLFGEMMTTPSLPTVLTPQMIHMQQDSHSGYKDSRATL